MSSNKSILIPYNIHCDSFSAACELEIQLTLGFRIMNLNSNPVSVLSSL